MMERSVAGRFPLVSRGSHVYYCLTKLGGRWRNRKTHHNVNKIGAHITGWTTLMLTVFMNIQVPRRPCRRLEDYLMPGIILLCTFGRVSLCNDRHLAAHTVLEMCVSHTFLSGIPSSWAGGTGQFVLRWSDAVQTCMSSRVCVCMHIYVCLFVGVKLPAHPWVLSDMRVYSCVCVTD